MVVAHVVCVIYAKLLTLFEIFFVPINRLPLLAWLCPVTQRTSSFIYACSMTSRAAKTLTQLRPPTNGQTSDISRRGRFTMTITFHAATLPWQFDGQGSASFTPTICLHCICGQTQNPVGGTRTPRLSSTVCRLKSQLKHLMVVV